MTGWGPEGNFVSMRLGVTGTGRIGTVHANTLSRHRDVGSLILTDADLARAQELALRLGETAAPGVDEIFRWLTGHTQTSLDRELAARTSFETFFATAPKLNPARSLITGVICGVRVQDIEEPLMREIRYLDKLIDELARGKAMEKILRA